MCLSFKEKAVIAGHLRLSSMRSPATLKTAVLRRYYYYYFQTRELQQLQPFAHFHITLTPACRECRPHPRPDALRLSRQPPCPRTTPTACRAPTRSCASAASATRCACACWSARCVRSAATTSAWSRSAPPCWRRRAVRRRRAALASSTSGGR